MSVQNVFANLHCIANSKDQHITARSLIATSRWVLPFGMVYSRVSNPNSLILENDCFKNARLHNSSGSVLPVGANRALASLEKVAAPPPYLPALYDGSSPSSARHHKPPVCGTEAEGEGPVAMWRFPVQLLKTSAASLNAISARIRRK